ncbi:type II secretion system minor pseudopilin GspJ [Saccharophagus degradans]|uniref:Type II secretion system protein J n=1 Tax=Saccharophagus degradans (strain 2-40 / ATCC 43961 / DSM 17024) TaxID=203122 RepID=Q21EQ0_SACD2|nr:type II secretion system minor pseudopilin GspJ [Saccharophagus degradans]ABD82829.1 General secretion pathway protein J [Saccharophagus degradans 2-40]
MNNSKAKCSRKQSGFTLIEVLVSITILALVSALSFQAFDMADRASDVTKRKLQEIQRIDRFWLALEMDLKNALGYSMTTPYGDSYPAMVVDKSENYWLMFLRGGKANPMLFPRTEITRVGYRYEENTIWRDSWVNPANPDPDEAFAQKMLEGVSEIIGEVLPPQARSIDNNAWLERWPPQGQPQLLPVAIKITVILEDEREIYRIFNLVEGL